jgi:NDP-sugar pyrophosphorylase family protein
VKHIFVNAHHFAEQVEKFLIQKNFFDAEIVLSQEDELLDTGGAIARLQDRLCEFENIFLHNADILSTIDLLALAREHSRTGARSTLACRTCDDDRRFLFDEAGQLIGWENRKTGERRCIREVDMVQAMGFCGISILNRGLFQFFPKEKKFSIVDVWLASVRENPTSVRAHTIGEHAACFDIGTPADLARTEASIPENELSRLLGL